MSKLADEQKTNPINEPSSSNPSSIPSKPSPFPLFSDSSSEATSSDEKESPEKTTDAEEKITPKKKITYKIAVDTTPHPDDTSEIVKIKQILENEKIDISFKENTLMDAFLLFEKITKVNIFFDSDIFKQPSALNLVNIELKQSQAKKVFSTLLIVSGLAYSYEEDGLHLKTIPEEEIEFLTHYQNAKEVIDVLFPKLRAENETLANELEYRFPTNFIKKMSSLSDNQKLGLHFLSHQENIERVFLNPQMDGEIKEEFYREIKRKLLPKYINLLNKAQQTELAKIVYEKIILQSE